MEPNIQTVLDFWFGPEDSPEYGQSRMVWWVQDDAFDVAVEAVLGDLSEAAKTGAFDNWTETPMGVLALIILLDQVPRNLCRGSAGAFAHDAVAFGHAESAVESGMYKQLSGVFRQFLLLPYQHAEDIGAQEKGVMLFDELGLAEAASSARQHRDIVLKFGRFPHRNNVLGRASTPEELAFLDDPDRPQFSGGSVKT